MCLLSRRGNKVTEAGTANLRAGLTLVEDIRFELLGGGLLPVLQVSVLKPLILVEAVDPVQDVEIYPLRIAPPLIEMVPVQHPVMTPQSFW